MGAAIWPLLARRPAKTPAAAKTPAKTPVVPEVPGEEAAGHPPEPEVSSEDWTAGLPPELKVPIWAVERPIELAKAVAALTGDQGEVVAITTRLSGAGGFGKTMLAKMVCADPRVLKLFAGRIHLVTLGRDLRGAAAIAAKVNEVIKVVTGENASFTDPRLAGACLGSLLDRGPRRLLVLDDVWDAEQLIPFIHGGRPCSRLVTTRMPDLLAGHVTAVRVDQMTPDQARALLTAGLPSLDPAVVQGLLDATGRWPLLLRLVNKILADHMGIAHDADIPAQAKVLLGKLRARGPAVVDHLTGADDLDVDNVEERARAVWATIGASTTLLFGQDGKRFAELGVFAEDEVIPFPLVARLWQATAGLDDLQASQLCARLVRLALITQAGGPDGGIAIHDVIRDYLRAQIGTQHLSDLNDLLLDAAATAANLPAASPLHGDTASLPQPALPRTAWWELDDKDRYLWDHLIEHLSEGSRPWEAEAVACDLRWAGARLRQFGPTAPSADLTAAGTSRAARLRTVLNRAAHLLTPTQPPGAVVDILHSRVTEDPDWGPQAAALRDRCARPRLTARWPPPDLPHAALRRALTGHVGTVFAVAIAPDGTWLATGGQDGTVRIWDAATGQERAVLTGHLGAVYAIAIAPDGTWLATGSQDGTARIWDAATGQERAVLARNREPVYAVAIAPDGTWLATGGRDQVVRLWDSATSTPRERATLLLHNAAVTAVAIAPDGTWLATGDRDGLARTWDVATGRVRAAVTRRSYSGVNAVAISPDGAWLATGSQGDTARVWDAATGQERAVLTGHHDSGVYAMAIAPDSTWLATAGYEGTVAIWDSATGLVRATLTGHDGLVGAVAIAPDGTWLAAGSQNGTTRIWDTSTGQQEATVGGHQGAAFAVAIAPDRTWLATGGKDGTTRIWDAATGRVRATFTGHHGAVNAVAIAPDGTWLATGGKDGTTRILDAVTGKERTTLTGAYGLGYAVAIAPDGTWLVTAGRDSAAQIRDTTTWQRHAIFGNDCGRVNAVAIAPDGTWVATGHQDGAIRIWDATTGQERATFARYYSGVHAVAIAPDGTWLAIGSQDGTTRILEIGTGRELATLPRHHGPVNAVAISPDGTWLATGSQDGTAQICDTRTWQTRAYIRVDASISSAAWLGSGAVALGGTAGLYLFDFRADGGKPGESHASACLRSRRDRSGDAHRSAVALAFRRRLSTGPFSACQFRPETSC
jgi:WD40 repeat protein